MSSSTSFPFTPKSTAKLYAGYFWAIPLDGDYYGCGVVLSSRLKADGKKDSRMFLAGLLRWFGKKPPVAEDVKDLAVIEHGFAHLKTITENGKIILGCVEPWWDWSLELHYTDDIPTWGCGVITLLAQKHLDKALGDSQAFE